MNKEVLFSTGKTEWSTPQDFFDKLNEEFHFDLDPCATDENHKCDTYFTKEQDGLKQDWGGGGIQSFVILLMEELIRGFGLKNVQKKLHIVKLLLC